MTTSRPRGVGKRKFPSDALELVAARFHMLSEPMRLRLLNELHSGERTVTQLTLATGAGQANVSKHLGMMADVGLVSRRKEGLNVFYFIVDESIFELCDLVCSQLHAELSAKAAAFTKPHPSELDLPSHTPATARSARALSLEV